MLIGCLQGNEFGQTFGAECLIPDAPSSVMFILAPRIDQGYLR